MDRRAAQKLAEQIIETIERGRKPQVVYKTPSGAIQFTRKESKSAQLAELKGWVIGVYTATARFDWIVQDLLAA